MSNAGDWKPTWFKLHHENEELRQRIREHEKALDAAIEINNAHIGRELEYQKRIRELEAWIKQAYKEGYLDAQNDESEGFDNDWEVSMTKMVYDEQREPPR